MEKIKTEISIIDGKTYYEIFVDDKPHMGTYIFELWIKGLLKLEEKLHP